MLWGLFSLIGLLVTHVLVHGRVQSVDRGVEVWFAAHRAGVWNSVTMFGADMAETRTAIVVTAMVVLLLRWRLGRWYESWIMAAAMVGELPVFYSVTATVHRPRPPVLRLDVAPPTSSFPSGHTATRPSVRAHSAGFLAVTTPRSRSPSSGSAALNASVFLARYQPDARVKQIARRHDGRPAGYRQISRLSARAGRQRLRASLILVPTLTGGCRS